MSGLKNEGHEYPDETRVSVHETPERSEAWQKNFTTLRKSEMRQDLARLNMEIGKLILNKSEKMKTILKQISPPKLSNMMVSLFLDK